jgi:hypothetical protein
MVEPEIKLDWNNSLDLARYSVQKIEDHLKSCDARYGDIKKNLEGLYKILWAAAGGIIMTLVTVVVDLLKHH